VIKSRLDSIVIQTSLRGRHIDALNRQTSNLLSIFFSIGITEGTFVLSASADLKLTAALGQAQRAFVLGAALDSKPVFTCSLASELGPDSWSRSLEQSGTRILVVKFLPGVFWYADVCDFCKGQNL
jgi:hypothetical protein